MQDVELTRAKIAHFEEQFGEQHGMFACQASVPLLLSTDLLYKLWLNFNTYNVDGQTKKIPHWAVSDLLLAGFCQPVGYQLYKLEPETRAYLQQLLLQRLGADRQIQLAGFLRQFAGKYYGGSEKNIQEIHLLTAESILNPAEMERQLSEQLQEKMKGNKADVVNLLSLYFNLSGGKKQEAGSENYINLVAEDDPAAPGYLNVILPRFLQDKVQDAPPAFLSENAPIKEEKPVDALSLVKDCLDSGNSLLDLGACGLTDADFVEGSILDVAIRRCTHLDTLILSNEWYGWKAKIRVKEKSSNTGTNNKLSAIPGCISSLTVLHKLICSGSADEPWGIHDMAPLTSVKYIEVLNLSYNQFTNVDSIKERRHLREVDLSYNQVNDVSPFREIFPLHILDIRHNQVTSLKPLADMLEGEFFFRMVMTPDPESGEDDPFYLFGNPITDPPADILEKGTKAVMEYFEGRSNLWKEAGELKKIFIWRDALKDENNPRLWVLTHDAGKQGVSTVLSAPGNSPQEDLIDMEECDGIILFYGDTDSNWFLMRQSMLQALILAKNKRVAVFVSEPNIEQKISRDLNRDLALITEAGLQTGIQKLLKDNIQDIQQPITKEKYIYDIYVSYSHNSQTTKKQTAIFLDELRKSWGDKPPNIFIDTVTISDGDGLPKSMQTALLQSKIMLTFLSPSYFKRRNSLVEWMSFIRRSDITNTPLVFPVALFKGEYLKNPLLAGMQYSDFSEFNLYSGNITRISTSPSFSQLMQALVGQINTALENVPEYNQTWQMVQDNEIDQVLPSSQRTKPIKVYLSSTYSDLPEYRQLILQIKSSLLQDYRIIFISMEGYAQEPEVKNLLRDVRDCDIFILIIGNRYGFIPSSQPGQLHNGRSIVEIEYDAARSSGKKIEVYIADHTSEDWVQTGQDIEQDENRQKRLAAFKKRLQSEALVRSFVKPLQLQQMVEEDLALLLKKDLKPTFHVGESYEIFSIYLSYADGNEIFVNKLRGDLMRLFPLLTIFESRDSMHPTTLIQEISDKITKADFFVFILSEAYSSSTFCRDEFQTARLNEYNSSKTRIMPIKISDAEPSLNIYNYYDFTLDYQLGFDALVSSFTEKMPVIKTVTDQKKLYIVYSSEDTIFYNDLKEILQTKGINLTNIEALDDSVFYQEDLQPLIESQTVFILLSNADLTPRSLAKIEYARQQKKNIELLVADGTIVAAQLQSFPTTIFDIDNEDDLPVLLHKYPYLLPEDKEIMKFYRRETLSQLIATSGKADPDETILEFLLIFKTSTQQTWLAFSTKNIFCLLDDLGKRGKSKLVQWKEKLEDARNKISTERANQKNVGLVNIGTHERWLYSDKLFRKPELIVNAINEYIRKCLQENKDVQ